MGPRRGTLVAGVLGAAAVGAAAAIAGRRQRRRRLGATISPSEALAGPPRDRLAPPDADVPPTDGAALPERDAAAAPSTPDGRTETVVDSGPDTTGPPAPERATLTTGPPAAAAAPATLTPPAATPTDAAPAGPPGPRPEGLRGDRGPHRPRRPRRQTRVIAVVVGVVVLALGIVGGIVAASTSESDPDAGASGTSTTVPGPTTTTTAPVAAPEAFGLASERLVAAGSFRYTGTASANDVSDVRPTPWLDVHLAVDGEVDTAAGRLRELAVADGGQAVESIADGPTVWGRKAQTVDQLAEQPYEFLPALSDGEQPARGAALLPVWLGSAVDPVDVEPDEQGRRRFLATIPAETFGEIHRHWPAVAPSATITVDGAGDPVHIEITSAPEGPDGPNLRLAFDITALGAPVEIQPPA
jgi:hypothetical protein